MTTRLAVTLIGAALPIIVAIVATIVPIQFVDQSNKICVYASFFCLNHILLVIEGPDISYIVVANALRRIMPCLVLIAIFVVIFAARPARLVTLKFNSGDLKTTIYSLSSIAVSFLVVGDLSTTVYNEGVFSRFLSSPIAVPYYGFFGSISVCGTLVLAVILCKAVYNIVAKISMISR